ncbi:MAG TPA: zinc ribbon domain-containing protein [Thermoanaerobaculia bacterium]|nr:zinc ribbon domain-containing protein [Thermoanaerobaculia bacterium]
MPLREYRCAACEKTFEILVLAGDDAATARCPSCGSKKMNRLLSTFAARGSAPARDAEPACGAGACAMPGGCGPSACGLDIN